jgi:type IV pilus assembly protein PilE
MKKICGFSLVELMVVVAIAAIIASIAYPAYQGQMQKTRRADAKAALMDAAAKMERHYTQFGNYSGTVAISATSSEGYYSITATVTGASSQTFTITADAPAGTAQDGDDCGDYVIDQAQQKTVSGTLAANICW